MWTEGLLRPVGAGVLPERQATIVYRDTDGERSVSSQAFILLHCKSVFTTLVKGNGILFEGALQKFDKA